MFCLWSSLNSSTAEEKALKTKLEAYKNRFKLTLNSYSSQYKPDKDINVNKELKKNERELVQKFAETLEISEDLTESLYNEYLDSTFNQFHVGDELFEKIDTNELVTVHFEKFVCFYYRERYAFIKILILIASTTGENVEVDYDNSSKETTVMNLVRRVFSKEDSETMHKSVLSDYVNLCKQVKVSSNTQFSKNPLITESFNQAHFVQAAEELELILELMLILVSVNKITINSFFEVGGEFAKYSIVKWLSSPKIASKLNSTRIIEQIAYLQILITVKLTKVEREVLGEGISDPLNNDEKIKFISTNSKDLISDIISSFGSNFIASPVMLACSSLLYHFSIDPNLGKVINKETKLIMNRMFASAVRENVLNNMLMMFASNIFSNKDIWLVATQVIYDLLNVVLHLFDENSLGENLRALFDICFFCMQKNKKIAEHFWSACKQPDRENLTILMSHAIETFPVNLELTFTFFSLIAKTKPEFCKQVVDYLTRMDQYCENFEDLDINEYISNGETLKLVRNRKLFDGYIIGEGQRGTIFASSSTSSQLNANSGHKFILQEPVVNWQLNYNCYDLIKTYFNRINYLSEKTNISCEPNVYSIIELIDSIFKYFFEIESSMSDREFEMNTKYMEMFVNSCFVLFSNLMDKEWPDSSRLISKLLNFFNNISSNIYHKLIKLLQQNELIGYNIACDQMTIEQILSNRHNLIKSLSKLKFIFQSNDKEMIANYIKLIDNLIKDNGNNIYYMNPLMCVLIYVFPDIFKWKANSFDLDLNLSVACLNLLHSILNTSLSNVSSFIQNSEIFFPKSSQESSTYSIDTLCEAILINTECSESLLNLIHVGYKYSNDKNYLNKIKQIDTILMQSISLVNRLIVIPTNIDEVTDTLSLPISQSALYLNLIKYINQQQTDLTDSSYSSRKALSDASIAKNNQFIMQLDVIMSKTGYSNSLKCSFDDKSSTNWFQLLTKIAIFKSNRTIDCLLFSLFKKISQLTPLLFGSLLGPYANQIHSILLSKISKNSEGQIVTIICEFLCSLIQNQPAFFQKLAELSNEVQEENATESSDKKENKPENPCPKTKTSKPEGDRSILKALFTLLSDLKKDNPDYYVSVSGVYSVFYTIWLNKKVDYIDYCKAKSEFWPMLSNTLHIYKKEINSDANKNSNFDEATDEYLEYLGIPKLDYENEFNEFIIEANVKSVSYALKIFSIQIFDLCFDKTNANELINYFSENVFEKSLIEKWLGFYTLQLKRDLADEAQHLFNTLEIAHHQERIIKADLSIIDINLYNKKNQNKNSNTAMTAPTKELKSKLLFDSITSMFLLVNKITRITNTSSSSKPDLFIEKINMKRIKLDVVYNYFIESILEIINYFLSLNNNLLLIQQEQDQVLEYEPILTKSTKAATKNFITLKQSNEIVKQFHSITNILMISITSIKKIDDSSLLNLKQQIYDLISILDSLMMEDFNYFPSVINSIQTSILHIFNSSSTQTIINILKEDENILKKLFGALFKIFTLTSNNLENEQDTDSTNFCESSHIFTLNTRILNFLMNKLSDEYWQKEMAERCVLQCLYSLFEKFIQNQKNAKIVFSVLEMLFTLANKQMEFLIKSDFNSFTCLLIGNLFDHCYTDNNENIDEKSDPKFNTITWSNVLCLYFDIQTVLLKNLKLMYLKDSIIFFGSYYETIAKIIIDSRETFEPNVLAIIRTFSRYLVQISKYRRELLINLPQSSEYLEKIFCDILHSCIAKTRQIKQVTTRLSQQLYSSSQKKDQLTTQQQAANLNAKKEIDALMSYVPNLGDSNCAIQFDEYKLLLSAQLAQPSSFDTFSSFSFGSIMWMIDYCLKIAQKNEIGSTGLARSQSIATTPKKNLDLNTEIISPKKNVTIAHEESAIETKFATKQIIIGVLERCLNFLLTQTVLFERQTQYSARDKKIFKRELSSEIESILQSFNKSFKRSASTIQYASKSPTKASSNNPAAASQTQSHNFVSFSSKHTCEFFKFIQTFLQQNVE